METLQASGMVQGVFFSLGTTPTTNDLKFDCATAVISLFNQAKKIAHVAIYSLIEPNIVNVIITANKWGIKVAIVADATESKNANMAAMTKRLTQAGVDVRLAVRQKALMHNKVGIFDSQIVCTGSFNRTNNAEKNNDENLLVVNGVDLAKDYETYVFQRILKNETLVRPV